MKQTIRAFVAIDVGPEVRAAAVKLVEKLAAAAADVKWVEPSNMHLTLKFLGDVALKETARICQAVQQAADECGPFDLEFRGVGAFPNPGRPRTVWLGTGSGREPLGALFDHVESGLQKLGFRRESRAFQGHLTLGRVRRGGPQIAELGRLLAEQAECRAGQAHVDQLLVFSSELTSSGPRYDVLGRAELSAGR